MLNLFGRPLFVGKSPLEYRKKPRGFGARQMLMGWLLASSTLLLSSCAVVRTDYRQPSYQQPAHQPYSLSSAGVTARRTNPIIQQPQYKPQPLPALPRAVVPASRTIEGSTAPTQLKPDYEKFKQVFAVTLQQWSKTGNKEVAAVVEFYSALGGYPLWYRREGWNPAGVLAHKTLRNAHVDGLNPQAYLPGETYQLDQLSHLEDFVNAEIMLTQGLMKYLVDVKRGLLHNGSRRAGGKILTEGLRSRDFGAWLASVPPQSRQYQGLRTAMAQPGLTQDQRRLVALNLERLRTPETHPAGRNLVLNLPAFTLDVYDGSKFAFDMPVVIGQKERPTPIMKDRIVDLKFSPDWSVPNIVAKEDILPLLKAKVPILDKMGVVVQKRGKRVKKPMNIKWRKYSATNLPYTFWQPPGPKNALGGVRFSLTNPEAIFMHDSPERDKFVLAQRLVSSGCVRVGDAIGLAHWIMSQEKGWSRDLVLKKMGAGRTETVRLNQPVSVNFVYYTAWVDKKGYIQFGDDIYGHDAVLAKKIGI